MSGRARTNLEAGARLLDRCAELFGERVDALAVELAHRIEGGARVLTCGNGGSAADAEHVATELAGRFYFDRPALDVLSITANMSLMTAVSNDYGYEEVFARQVMAYGRRGDVLMLFTTSGRSPNMLRAQDAARDRGLFTIGFTGARGAAFCEACDVGFVVPSDDVPRIQEAHIALAHSLCAGIEDTLFGRSGGSTAKDRD
jgi:D-sedoheptulose 7-phosphate isomerase